MIVSFGTSPLPHPATHTVHSMGGRVGISGSAMPPAWPEQRGALFTRVMAGAAKD